MPGTISLRCSCCATVNAYRVLLRGG
ncbi:hypothetical protein EE896_20245 (plasmid) [Pantoea eucalypti]|uniref:InsA N-terminal domain-containing protein n=1 Tax=Pantoea eucalypti TaxID=470933 RepID=A0ABY2ZQ86_9GAMM|nr:hypothetical protein EE896_20245 [Pantoea eucalypti]TPV36917.1 hypothetical protein FJW02_10170 [Pantoea eucalypti]